jgi:hypothetical protein
MLMVYMFCGVFTCALSCTILFTVHKYPVSLRWFISFVEYLRVYYQVKVCSLFKIILYHVDGLPVL